MTNVRATAVVRARWAPVVVAVVAMTTGPLLVMWTQYLLYGGLFAPSYRSAWDWMFSTSYIPRNLELAPGFLTALHSRVAFAGLLTPLLVGIGPGRRDATDEQRRIAIACLAVAVINFLLYLPYYPYEDPHSIRFQMPAVVCLFVLLAGLSAWLWRRLRAWTPALAALALVPAAVVLLSPRALLLYPLSFQQSHTRVALMGHYLQAVVPANAVILAYLQSGPMAHYTNLPVVRLDQLPADALDRVVADLVAHGYEPVLLLGEDDDVPDLATRFPSSPLARLDWPARARAVSNGGFAYFRVADRALYAAGARWPVAGGRAAGARVAATSVRRLVRGKRVASLSVRDIPPRGSANRSLSVGPA